MADNPFKKNFQKIVVIIAGGALLGVMSFPMFSPSPERSPSSSEESTSANASPDKQIESVVQGYEKVLAREPNNPTAQQGLGEALQALVESRLQQQDLNGAIPPLEKLVKLQENLVKSYPEEAQLKDKLNKLKEIEQKLKQEQSKQKAQPSPSSPK